MGVFHKSSIKIDSQNQGGESIDTSNLKIISTQAQYGTSNNSTPTMTVEYIDLNDESTNSNTIEPATQTITAEEAVQLIHDEITGKTLVSIRPAEGDELALFSEITTYEDGTIVRTGLNQSYFPGGLEYITIPIDPENGIYRDIVICDGSNDGLVIVDNINQVTTTEDPNFGTIQESKEISSTKFYTDRSDGLVKVTIDQESDCIKRMEFINNPNGIVAEEIYADRDLIFYEDGTIKTLEK